MKANPLVEASVAFLNEAAVYFEKRPTGGEDMAHWANVFNAQNCRQAATLIEDQGKTWGLLANLLAVIHRDGGQYQAEHGDLRATNDAITAWTTLITRAETAEAKLSALSGGRDDG